MPRRPEAAVMPLPTPFAAQTAAGLDLTAWWISRIPRLPGAPAPRMGAGDGFPIVRVHHAEHRAWRPPVVCLDGSLPLGIATDPLPFGERRGLVDALAHRGHAVWLVGPGGSLDDRTPSGFFDTDLPLAQRLIWGQEARAAFWLDRRRGRWLVRALPGLEPRRMAGLVVFEDTPTATLRHRLSGLYRRLVHRARCTTPGGDGSVADMALSAGLPLLETNPRTTTADAGWPLLTDWLDAHHGHSPERTIRLAAASVWPVAA